MFISLTPRLQAQLVSFNFSAAASVTSGWTNVAGNPSQAVRQATAGGITISSIATANWQADQNGLTAVNGAGAGGGFFPTSVMSNDWFQWCGFSNTLGQYNASTPQLQLSGLNKDSTYILRMTGSSSVGGNTQYTVAGAVNYGSQQINTGYNTTLGATFMQVRPDAAGTVKVYVNATSSGGGMISGLQVYPGSAPVGAPSVTFLAPADGTIAAQGTIITLKATAVEAGATITKMEFFADAVKIGEVATAPYTFNWVNPDTGRYHIIARATDNIGTTNTDTISVSVLPLNALVTAGQGLSQGPDGLSLGDTIPGPGPHKFLTNRYQYLNGKMYSIGGSVNEPVNHPAFRVYSNGDITAGTTMDTSVNTNDQQGMRYYSKLGIMQIGASDRLDTTQNPIVYGIWPSSGLIINSDDHNNIKGKIMNTVICADVFTMDSATRTENVFIALESSHVFTAAKAIIRSFIGGYGNSFSAPVSDCAIVGQGINVSKPAIGNFLGGYVNAMQDTTYGSIVCGAYNKFGGVDQLVSGQYLVNRTPFGTTLGNGNVDFATLPYTGNRGATAAGIAGYPLFVLGNSAINTGSGHSNAMTVLYNGRTQINTTGFTNTLSQTEVTPKAALDVVSTNTGVLLPRLTNAQRNAITAGDLQNGLLLYNTDSSAFQFYNGSSWNSVGTGASSGKWLYNGGLQYDSLNNVAIGTSQLPSGYRLAVKGAAVFTRVQVLPIPNWPDYVFKKGYRLRSLQELESYIGKYRHLPEMASAATVATSGIDLGVNQAALLKKVEELTLYLIDENKQLKTQNTQLTEQGKKMEDMQRQLDELKALLIKK
jgi:hypothetical protein